MARHHIKPKAELPKVSIQVIAIESTRLVTLERPGDKKGVKGAFVRLKPPEGTPRDTAEAWRGIVLGAGAVAVRLLPTPTAAAVPLTSTRVDVEVSSPRKEVEALLEEADDPLLTNTCQAIMSACKM